MQVISGAMGREIVHYEAVPGLSVEREMDQFLGWWTSNQEKEEGLIRAGLAHFYFVTIHPFEDGNGRIGRAVAEKALAQSLGRPTLFALADAIKRRQKDYYRALEEANKSNEITAWLTWFADIVVEAEQFTQARVESIIEKTKLLDRLRGQLNDRQEKALLRMLEEGPGSFKDGMSADKYIRITQTSRATATRDLQDLVEKGTPRDDANKAVQENAMAAWETDTSFRERVAKDPRIAKFLDGAALENTFDLQRHLRYVDAIFARVFIEKAAEKTATTKA